MKAGRLLRSEGNHRGGRRGAFRGHQQRNRADPEEQDGDHREGQQIEGPDTEQHRGQGLSQKPRQHEPDDDANSRRPVNYTATSICWSPMTDGGLRADATFVRCARWCHHAHRGVSPPRRRRADVSDTA